MTNFSGEKIGSALLYLGVLWLGLRYLLPVAMPFLLGAALALAAEPVVVFCTEKGKLPRVLASGVGICGVLTAIVTLLSLVGAAAVREIGTVMQALPDLEQTARDGMGALQNTLYGLAERSPEGIRPLLSGTVSRFFNDGTALMDRVTDRIPGLVASVLGAVPDGLLGIGTGLLAGFMISARLPALRKELARRIPDKWQKTYFPAFRRVRSVLWGWLRAQLTLCLITFGIVTVGFLMMKLPYAPAWAALVALVDAVPLLGTGTVLLPCALVSFVQGEAGRAVFYLGIFAVASGVRTALEPKLVGKNLGLDPLLTLIAIYVGYRFWGFLGLILAPMVAGAIMQILNAEKM